MRFLLLSLLAPVALANSHHSHSNTSSHRSRLPNAVDVVSSAVSTHLPQAVYIASSTGLDGPKLTAINNASYEWWYFDAVSDDAQSSIAVVFYTAPQTAFPLIPADGVTHAKISYKFPGEDSVNIVNTATEAKITTNGNGASGSWRGSGLSFTGSADLSTYRVDVNIPAKGKNPQVKGSMIFTSTAPPHLPCGPVAAGSPMTVFPSLGWVNAMPSAKTAISLQIGEKKVAFTGLGYHDHNWGDKPILEAVKSWYWGHGAIGGNSLVWFTGLDAAGVPSVSAYLTPTSSQSGTPLYSTCDMTKFSVVHSKGGIFDISFFPDGAGKKPKAFHVHVKPSQLVGGAEGSGYTRWSGTLTGGWAGQKNTTGVALYKHFGPGL